MTPTPTAAEAKLVSLGDKCKKDNYAVATGLLLYAGITDWLDGFLAHKYQMTSILGTILDPTADKALVGTLVITLTIQRLLPFLLAIVIVGRDLLLSLKTFQRYWDFLIPSAEVRPTTISKVNTALQLVLMGSTTISPLLPGMAVGFGLYLEYLQWTVAMTTIWSGLSYIFLKDAVHILSNAH
ncbi:hypothetical protein B0F90DRAFT_1812084 [Multifurca ochricompacta]|uniref:CDP-diacylglycerol--glycerol-3-phosphate 3-phosphatidyltransferase n=1 Tax=Multifurca ochricompacta TaxID=376703 RepID=A0AAD4LW02_9AGAM|nr:hypothetical protein B0F90DRAFT_1812084 [Multifurca ochricompacta]